MKKRAAAAVSLVSLVTLSAPGRRRECRLDAPEAVSDVPRGISGAPAESPGEL